MDKLENKLDEKIDKMFDDLNTLETGTMDHSKAVDDLDTLCKLKIKTDEMRVEKQYKAVEAKLNARRQLVTVIMDGIKIVVPTVVYVTFLRKGFKFEETGSFTSGTFRTLINKLNPFK